MAFSSGSASINSAMSTSFSLRQRGAEGTVVSALRQFTQPQTGFFPLDIPPVAFMAARKSPNGQTAAGPPDAKSGGPPR